MTVPLIAATVAMGATGVTGVTGATRAAGPVAEAAVGSVLPEVTLRGINGRSRHLSEYRGKPLLINVWASWCGPCRQESASLERLAWRNVAKHFNLIAISTDDDVARSIAWLKHSHAIISQFIDADRQMEGILGASRLPLTVLVAADGRVLRKIYGAREWDSADSLQLLQAVFSLPSD